MEEMTDLQKLGVAFLVGAIVASGVWYFATAKSAPSASSSLTKVAETSSDKTTTKPSELTVDISGAVTSPGVYKLPEGSRVNDALLAAGGVVSDKVNQEYLSKSVNLSQKVTDGLKIYIPFVTDNAVTLSPSVAGLATSTELISVNQATASELDTLAGVGPATATKIIDGRPYASLDELVTKKALGQSVYEKIKDKLTL